MDWDPQGRGRVSWVRQYLVGPRVASKVAQLSPEDAEALADKAAQLRALGCTAEQVERHLSHLKRIAGAKTRDAPKQPNRPPTFRLTEDQIAELMPVLAERPWRWIVWLRDDADDDWVGHAILAITGVPDDRSHVGYLVRDVLDQLSQLGLVKRVRGSVPREAPTGPNLVAGSYRVEVVGQLPRKHRERLAEPVRVQRVRLQDAELPQTLPSTGATGLAHAATADARSCHVSPTSGQLPTQCFSPRH